MKIKKYHVDAFADKLFEGNPAAVCLLDEYLSDELLTAIAAEHNLAETAFIVEEGDSFFIRWFTPTVEIELCGHATLASAFVIFNHTDFIGKTIHFKTKAAGDLYVTKENELLTLNFPSDMPEEVVALSAEDVGLSVPIKSIWRGRSKYMVVLDHEKDITNLKVDLNIFKKLDVEGVIYTAEGQEYDFVSRFFCPEIGIEEDPVTGSAHTVLTPYWAQQFNKNQLVARQLSDRGGTLYCELDGDRTLISGRAQLYSEAEIYLPLKINSPNGCRLKS